MASNPQYAVDEARTVDAILKSIRSKVRSNRSGAADGTKSEDPAEIARLLEHVRQQLDHGQLSAQTAVVSPPNSSAKSQDILTLEIEVEAALIAHRQVGQLNPRLPGLHNRALQLVKKTMRRSLTWYTRPLHHFQGAILRSLRQVSAILQSHGDSLQKMDGKLDNSMSACAQQIADMRREVDVLQSELWAVKEQLARADIHSSEGGGKHL